jgi:hypothetical protein
MEMDIENGKADFNTVSDKLREEKLVQIKEILQAK